jgi:hypothetical protein
VDEDEEASQGTTGSSITHIAYLILQKTKYKFEEFK